jgi:ParB/RepB/Spo0J family partition protein
MATTTSTQDTTSTSLDADESRVELRSIPLSAIVVVDGLNPRGEIVEDDELQEMAETMRRRGCLQSIRVKALGNDEYALIAGGRRYRAAALAALTEIPAVVLPAGAGDEAEHLELLCDAMIENEVRSDLNPLQRAQGFQAMIDCGLTVRGVAERMGGKKAKRASRERRIREHLAILALPETVRGRVAAEEVPLLAVKALTELAAIHEELPGYAVAAVLDVDERHAEPYTWAEVMDRGLQVALADCDRLPAGLFSSTRSYPLDVFALSEKAKKDLAAYAKLVGGAITAMRFTFELIEQAHLLGAAHNYIYGTLIVGQDVATSLAEDYIACILKDTRAQLRRQREAEQESESVNAGTSEEAGSVSGDAGSAQESGKADVQAQRDAEREKRDAAIRFNLDLGVLAFKHLPKVKVDERVLRILASVDLARSLREIATRGARISMPGWVTQTQQKNGKLKTSYLESYEAERRASQFLQGAVSAGEIAGRTLTLIALASLANESDALPQSRRSYHRLAFRGPWAVQAQRDLDAIVRERIKEGQLPALDAILQERITEAEQEIRHEQEIANAAARVESVRARLAELDENELDEALSDAELAWGTHGPEARTLRALINALREERAAAQAGEHEHSEEPLAVAA